MKNLIDRERLRENHNRIAEKNKAGSPKDTKAAPAKGDGRGNPNRKGSPSRGRSQERSKGDKVCYNFQKGQCDKGKKCPFKHVKDDKSRTQSPRRNRTRSPSKGNKDDKGKKMSKEEMAKTPCIYHAQGKCRRGDKCFYKHDDKAAATKDTKRTNSLAPKFPFEYKQKWTKVWGFMFRRHVFSEAEYIEYICKKNSYKQLLTWAGIVDVRTDGTQGFLDRVYERNLPLVIENIGRKQKQSIAAKADPQAERKRKADDEEASRTPTAATSSSAQAAASSGSAPFLMPEAPAPKSGAKPFREPEVRPSPKASSSGHPDASSSWNRDHYGARREWSYWRGAWYFRDGAGGRWIYWNR